MSDTATFVAIAGAFVVVACTPGPANLAAATVSMSQGRRRGVVFALGLGIGLLFWGVLAALGLGAILQTSVMALVALKLAGGLYLLWLALQSARSALQQEQETKPTRVGVSDGRWLMRGLILNMSNPKAVFAWMAALSVGLDPGDGAPTLIAATAMCGLIGFANTLGHAWLFSLPGVMAAYARGRRTIEAGASALFAAAGLGLLRSAMLSRATG